MPDVIDHEDKVAAELLQAAQEKVRKHLVNAYRQLRIALRFTEALDDETAAKINEMIQQLLKWIHAYRFGMSRADFMAEANSMYEENRPRWWE